MITRDAASLSSPSPRHPRRDDGSQWGAECELEEAMEEFVDMRIHAHAPWAPAPHSKNTRGRLAFSFSFFRPARAFSDRNTRVVFKKKRRRRERKRKRKGLCSTAYGPRSKKRQTTTENVFFEVTSEPAKDVTGKKCELGPIGKCMGPDWGQHPRHAMVLAPVRSLTFYIWAQIILRARWIQYPSSESMAE